MYDSTIRFRLGAASERHTPNIAKGGEATLMGMAGNCDDVPETVVLSYLVRATRLPHTGT